MQEFAQCPIAQAEGGQAAAQEALSCAISPSVPAVGIDAKLQIIVSGLREERFAGDIDTLVREEVAKTFESLGAEDREQLQRFYDLCPGLHGKLTGLMLEEFPFDHSEHFKQALAGIGELYFFSKLVCKDHALSVRMLEVLESPHIMRFDAAIAEQVLQFYGREIVSPGAPCVLSLKREFEDRNPLAETHLLRGVLRGVTDLEGHLPDTFSRKLMAAFRIFAKGGPDEIADLSESKLTAAMIRFLSEVVHRHDLMVESQQAAAALERVQREQAALAIKQAEVEAARLLRDAEVVRANAAQTALDEAREKSRLELERVRLRQEAVEADKELLRAGTEALDLDRADTVRERLKAQKALASQSTFPGRGVRYQLRPPAGAQPRTITNEAHAWRDTIMETIKSGQVPKLSWADQKAYTEAQKQALLDYRLEDPGGHARGARHWKDQVSGALEAGFSIELSKTQAHELAGLHVFPLASFEAVAGSDAVLFTVEPSFLEFEEAGWGEARFCSRDYKIVQEGFQHGAFSILLAALEHSGEGHPRMPEV